MQRHSIVLPGDGSDLASWRSMARWLWAQQVPPEHVTWLTESGQQYHPDLFAAPQHATQLQDLPAAPDMVVTVPRAWMTLAEHALLNSAPERFGVLYRMFWRMQHHAALRHDPLDPDRVQLQLWAKAVRREVHKMHAFVRFRPVDIPDSPEDGTGPLHVAWFEPEHHIVQAAAPFFVKRFTHMRWSILTPQCCLRWWPQAADVTQLAGQGVNQDHALQPLRGRPGVLSWGPGAQACDAPPCRRRRSLMAHLLRAHLQSSPSQSGSHAQGNASQVLAQPARGPVDCSTDSGSAAPIRSHAEQCAQHTTAQAAA